MSLVSQFALFVVRERDRHHGRVLVVRRGKYFGLPIIPLDRTRSIQNLFREAILPFAMTTTIGANPHIQEMGTIDGEWEFKPATFTVYTAPSVWAISRLNGAILINPNQMTLADTLQIGDPDFSIDFLLQRLRTTV